MMVGKGMKDSKQIAKKLRQLVKSKDSVIENKADMHPFETDAYTIAKELPLAVVFPSTTDEVTEILSYCYKNSINVVPRGAGTSLSGGSIPVSDGILMVMSKFNKILEIDIENRCAVVQPGLVNMHLTEAVKDKGFFYAPDPSSQSVCTIGGNVAENSGGLHCLKYGLTSHNLMALECVLIDGSVIRLGGKHPDALGMDLLGVITGSEGMLAVVTEITVKLIPQPDVITAVLMGFDKVIDASKCVSAILRSGLQPASLEMMDKECVIAAENYVHAGYPVNVAALLITELDGIIGDVEEQVKKLFDVAKSYNVSYCRASNNEEERQSFWAGRKAAFPAVAAISPDYLCMDGSIPRNKLAEVLAEIQVMSNKYQLKVVNVFHAGDGNLHPLILFDASIKGELNKAEAIGADILKLCVAVGGVLSGEHGIGLEKKNLMHVQFNQQELSQQERLKCAFDDIHALNPDKIFPILHRCVELGWMHVSQKGLPHSDIPRF